MQPTLMVITGPTAVGKTALAVRLAKQLNTSVISADSRQFYRELKIGTARPDESELEGVPHFFLGERSVTDYYSAGDFERDGLEIIDRLFREGKNWVIAIGGSGLYVKALCEGLDEMPAVDEAFRQKLIQEYRQNGLTWLQDQLQQSNPEAFRKLDTQNPQRLMRAIELAYQGGIKSKSKINRPFRMLHLGLELPREELYNRINRRVDHMMELGLLEEVRSLMPFRELNALQTVGYQELFDYLDGKCSLERAVGLIKQHTRNYAKRQLTWFRKTPCIRWFHPDDEVGVRAWIDSMETP